jgi:hypothetical protein
MPGMSDLSECVFSIGRVIITINWAQGIFRELLCLKDWCILAEVLLIRNGTARCDFAVWNSKTKFSLFVVVFLDRDK